MGNQAITRKYLRVTDKLVRNKFPTLGTLLAAPPAQSPVAGGQMVKYVEWMQWDDAYGLGVDSIDAQHKRWFRLLDELTKAASEHGTGGQVEELLVKVIEFSTQHFEYEERLLRQSGYPDFENHKRLHDGFLKHLAQTKNDLVQWSREDAAKIATMLDNWVRNHVLMIDINYAKHLRDSGISTE